MIMKKEDFTHLPNHVAIIMDGNGRWAKKIGKKRAFGHENGTKSVRDCIDQSLRLGIKNLTLYVFSTENWNRPKFEVNALMDLLVYSLENERVNLIENGIKLNVIGEIETLKDKAKTKLKSIISETKSNKKLNLNLAISYGSKQEIVNAIREVSNFLLWQIAYAEMYFTDLLWPDFKKEDFIDALDDYQKRDRRFGKIN